MRDDHQQDALLTQLAAVRLKRDTVQATLRTHPRVMSKQDIIRQAQEWGWQVTNRGKGRHPTKAVRGNLKISIPGHGDSDELQTGLVHQLLKQLSEPILTELNCKEHQYSQQLIDLLLAGNPYNGSFQEFRIKQELEFYRELAQAQQDEIQRLEMQIQESEEAALELCSNLEYDNQTLVAKVKTLAEERVQLEWFFEQVLSALKQIQFHVGKLESIVNLIPGSVWIKHRLQRQIDHIKRIFDANNLAAAPLQLPRE